MPHYDAVTVCDCCEEVKPCRLTDCGRETMVYCRDCDDAAQEEATAAVEAAFDDVRYGLTAAGYAALHGAAPDCPGPDYADAPEPRPLFATEQQQDREWRQAERLCNFFDGTCRR